MAVWSQAWYIMILLISVILGHWVLLLHGLSFFDLYVTSLIAIITGILLKAVWTPEGCAIVHTDNTLLAATFIYSMTFDAIVLILTGWKLAFPTRRKDRSRLVGMVFDDGLIFFFIA